MFPFPFEYEGVNDVFVYYDFMGGVLEGENICNFGWERCMVCGVVVLGCCAIFGCFGDWGIFIEE